jgi:hypothetical protein
MSQQGPLKIGILSMPGPRLFVTFTIKTARKEKHLYVPAPIHQSRGKYASYSCEDNAFTAVASANVVKSSLETIASFQGPWCNSWMLIHCLHSRDVHPRLSSLLHSRGIFPPLSISYRGEAGFQKGHPLWRILTIVRTTLQYALISS